MVLALGFGLVMSSCQKLDRPELGAIQYDPEPPAFSPLKSYFAFENNLTDAGESGLMATNNGTTFAAGVTGQGLQVAQGQYILLPIVGDTTVHPNEFVGIPADTVKNLGSATVSFWLNAPSNFDDGAQGIFSFSNKTTFWGNFDVFLENYKNAADATEGFLKIHMLNSNAAAAAVEQWNEVKIPNFFGKWTHIAITYDGGTSQISVYADGAATSINNKVLAGGAWGKLSFADFNGLSIGTHQFQTNPSLTDNTGAQSWASSFKGTLDNFRLYNRALTAAEVQQLFTNKE